MSETDALRRLLTAASERVCAEGAPILASMIVPVAPVDPLGFFVAGVDVADERVFWRQPADGFALVGVGEAAVVAPNAVDRFDRVAAGWRDLVARALVEGAGPPGTGPLLLGGFAFDPAHPTGDCWRGFPAARLALPRHLLTISGGRAWLTTSALVDPGDDAATLRARAADLARERTRLLAGADLARAYAGVGDVAGVTVEEALSPDDWRALVAEGARAVRAGCLEKVVLAREVRLRADRPLDVPLALDRLTAAYRTCYVFAFAQGEQTFLGATPERLVRLAGGELRATCLAGSTRRGTTVAEDRRLAGELLASAKDRREHAVVVRVLCEALAGLCDEVRAPEEPTLLSVSNVHHLYTPVVARLRPGRTLLDAVARLHPTPAVGGFPRDAALRFICERERLDRGWYAAPIGWLDRDGAGEFAVALRSGLVDGAGASLYAGCGVMGDSDPEQEYAESWLKLRPMLAALGGAVG